MLSRSKTVLLLLRNYRKKSVVVLLSLLLSGIAGGAGLLTVFPLLEITVGNTEPQSRFYQNYSSLLALIGLSPSVGTTLLLIVIFLWSKALLHLKAMDYVGGVVAGMASDLRIGLMRAVVSARWSFFVSNPIGSFTNAVTVQAQEASSAYRASCQFVASLVEIAILAMASFLVSPLATIGGLLFGALIMFFLSHFVAMARVAGRQTFEAMHALSCHLADLLQGIKPLKAMHCEHLLTPILEHESEEINSAVRKQVRAKYGLSTMREPIAAVVLAGGLYIALQHARISMPQLLTTAILFHRISVAISSAQQAYQLVGTSEHFFWGIKALTESAQKNKETDGTGKAVSPIWDTIRTVNLSFAYDDKAVLRSVSMSIPRGKFTAIIGPSGSGKTTLSDMLCGITQPDQGQILVGDIPLDELDLGAWRRTIGYVPQELFLFHDSVLHNVTLKDQNITRDQVESALRAAGAWEDFVEKMPRGLETIIGERGLMLSGGQRQRIAIARALVRQPQLLLLDEATTALDPVTEKEILETLRDLVGKVTIVAISHQAAVMAAAEHVFRLESGTVHQLR